jgi:hypothetical protein
MDPSSVHPSDCIASIFPPHHIGSTVKPNFPEQIYVPEGNYGKVCGEAKDPYGVTVFQLTGRSTRGRQMNMSDIRELPA